MGWWFIRWWYEKRWEFVQTEFHRTVERYNHICFDESVGWLCCLTVLIDLPCCLTDCVDYWLCCTAWLTTNCPVWRICVCAMRLHMPVWWLFAVTLCHGPVWWTCVATLHDNGLKFCFSACLCCLCPLSCICFCCLTVWWLSWFTVILSTLFHTNTHERCIMSGM